MSKTSFYILLGTWNEFVETEFAVKIFQWSEIHIEIKPQNLHHTACTHSTQLGQLQVVKKYHFTDWKFVFFLRLK